MIKYEFKKMYNKGYIQVLIIFSLIGAIICPVLLIQGEITFEIKNEDQYIEYKGREAIKKEKVRYKNIEGLLTTDKLCEALEVYDNARKYNYIEMEQEYPGILNLLYSSYSSDKPQKNFLENIKDTNDFYWNRVETIKNKLELYYGRELFNEKDKIEIVERAQEIKKPFNYSYYGGWIALGENIIFINILVTVIVLLTASDIFSYEIEKNIDPIFSTLSNKSIKSIAKSKVLTANIFTIILYLSLSLISSIVLFNVFGINGVNTQIQSFFRYWLSIYNISFLQFYILQIVISILSLLTITNVTLLVDSISRNKYSTIIISGVLLILPKAIIRFNLPLFLDKFIKTMPVNALNLNGAITSQQIYNLHRRTFLTTTTMIILYLIVCILLNIIIPKVYYSTFKRGRLL